MGYPTSDSKLIALENHVIEALIASLLRGRLVS